MKPPKTAMILAAGLGKRLRPITLHTPKPLVHIANKALIDYSIDLLKKAGVKKIIINIHHLGQKIIDFLASIDDVEIVISDERKALLDSAGGIIKALPLIGDEPFFVLNADSFWLENKSNNLLELSKGFEPDKMDIRLLVTGIKNSTGHSKGYDFVLNQQGLIQRFNQKQKITQQEKLVIYTGAALLNPALFHQHKPVALSLNHFFDQTISRSAAYGHQLKGHFITVGTLNAIKEAEKALKDFAT